MLQGMKETEIDLSGNREIFLIHGEENTVFQDSDSFHIRKRIASLFRDQLHSRTFIGIGVDDS